MKRLFVLALVVIWRALLVLPSLILCLILDWISRAALHLHVWAHNVACMALVEGGLATIVDEDEPDDKA